MSDHNHHQEARAIQTPDSQEIQVSWKSALPPPNILEEYQKLLPNAAERYFALIEKQSNHRQLEETKNANRMHRLSWGGMVLGFFVNIGALATAGWLASMKIEGAAIAAIIAAILTNLVFFTSFVQNKK